MMQKIRILFPIIGLGLFLSIGVCTRAEIASAKPEPMIRFISAGLKNASEKLTCMQLKLTYKFEPTKFSDTLENAAKAKDPSAPSQKISKMQVLWAMNSSNLYEKKETFHDTDKETPSNTKTLWVVGGVAYILSTDRIENNSTNLDRQINNGTITYSSSVLTEAGLWKTNIELDPRFLLFGMYSPSLADNLLQVSSNSVFMGYETIGENKCAKVETHSSENSKDIYWIDINHGFVIIKRESFLKIAGRMVLYGVIQADNLTHYDTIWLPSSIHVKIYQPEATGDTVDKKDKSPVSKKPDGVIKPPTFEHTYIIKNVIPGCQAILPITWPLGTVVSDDRTMESLTVVAINKNVLSKLNTMRKLDLLPPLQEFALTEEDKRELLKDSSGSVKNIDQVTVALNATYLTKLKKLRSSS